MVPEPKPCAACGRPFAWRKKWARSWADVKFCSAACRQGKSQVGAKYEAAILELLDERSARATICPSEVARALSPQGWRDRMDDVRAAAIRLVAKRRVVVTQHGEPVDPLTARGPIRIRKA